VRQDVTVIGGNLDQHDSARIDGDVITNDGSPLSLTIPGGLVIPAVRVHNLPFLNGLGFIFKVFLWAALAVLAALFTPQHIARVSRAAVQQPLVSGGLGLLTVVVLVPALLIMAITIIMLPVSIVVAAMAALAWVYGLLALGTELGRRMAESLKQDWAPALSAAIGTFVLMFVLDGAALLIDCLGWIFPFLAGLVGLGAVILTRFGMQPYPQFAPARPVPPVPPVAPVAAIPPAAPDIDPLASTPIPPGEDPGDSGPEN
jgi:hypothetical protein